MKEMAWQILVRVFRLIPGPIRRQCCRLAFHAAAAGKPKAGLLELLDDYDQLRNQIDKCGIRYEGGIHPKHRLTAYHRFFVERIAPGARVLDVGCGYGAVAASLAEAGAIVTGVDIDAESLRAARERFVHANLRFVAGDATRELPDERFGVIVLSNVLEHLEHRVVFLRKLADTFGPCRFLIRLPMINRDWLVPLKQELGVPFYSDPGHYTEYTEATFRAEMAAAGLAVGHVQIQWGEIWAEVNACRA